MNLMPHCICKQKEHNWNSTSYSVFSTVYVIDYCTLTIATKTVYLCIYPIYSPIFTSSSYLLSFIINIFWDTGLRLFCTPPLPFILVLCKCIQMYKKFYDFSEFTKWFEHAVNQIDRKMFKLASLVNKQCIRIIWTFCFNFIYFKQYHFFFSWMALFWRSR